MDPSQEPTEHKCFYPKTFISTFCYFSLLFCFCLFSLGCVFSYQSCHLPTLLKFVFNILVLVMYGRKIVPYAQRSPSLAVKTSWHGNVFRFTGSFRRQSTDRYLSQRISYVELWCFPLMLAWTNWWTNSRIDGDLIHPEAHVMSQ